MTQTSVSFRHCLPKAFTHHIQVSPDGSPFSQSGGDLMHQRQLCGNDRLLWSNTTDVIIKEQREMRQKNSPLNSQTTRIC